MSKNASISPPPKDQMTLAEMDQLATAWVSSPEGKRKLDAAARAGQRAVEKVMSDAKVDPEQLRRAVTL